MSSINWANDAEVDEFIRQGLLAANKPVFVTEMPFALSEKYTKWEKTFLASPFRYAKRAARSALSNVLRAAAIALLVVSVSFGTLLAVNPEARAAVVNWFVERFTTHDEYRFTGETDENEARNWEPSWLPDGYVEVERIEFSITTIVIYENEIGTEIDIEFSQMVEGGLVNRDNEDMEISKRVIDGQLYNIYESLIDEKRNCVIWADDESNTMFTVTSHESIDVLLRVAKNIS